MWRGGGLGGGFDNVAFVFVLFFVDVFVRKP